MAKSSEDTTPESDALTNAPHPRMTDHLFGQNNAEQEILEAYRGGKLPHAWILGGEKGIGKATLAWRFAKFVLSYPDPAHPFVQNATRTPLCREFMLWGMVMFMLYGGNGTKKPKNIFPIFGLRTCARLCIYFNMRLRRAGIALSFLTVLKI